MPRQTKKTANGRKPRTARQGYIMTRIEPDVAKDVRTERKRNGRTVQGEVNAILRDHYASKWSWPDGTMEAAKKLDSLINKAIVGKGGIAEDALMETPEDRAMLDKELAKRGLKRRLFDAPAGSFVGVPDAID